MVRPNRPVPDASLRAFFRELVCCLGRVAARHQLPEDAVWELVKGFDILYLRARDPARRRRHDVGGLPPPHRLRPHPGVVYLLDKLGLEEREDST